MTTATFHPEFDVTESTHRNCTRCADAANMAATMANLTGSRGATYRIDVVSPVHEATVARVRCNSGRSDCACPVCVDLARFQPADPFEGLQ